MRFRGWAIREAPYAPGAPETCFHAARDFRKKRGTSLRERTSNRDAMTKASVPGAGVLTMVQRRVGMAVALSEGVLDTSTIYVRQ